jgi:Animal haem peroxidase
MHDMRFLRAPLCIADNQGLDLVMIELILMCEACQKSMVHVNLYRHFCEHALQSLNNILCMCHRNQMTHWWDASQIYGPSKEFAYKLREVDLFHRKCSDSQPP